VSEGDTIHRAASRIRAALGRGVPEEILAPHPRHRADSWPQQLRGRAVRSVDTHGKHLFLRFDGGLTLHSHLRMTGLWGVYRQGEAWRRAPGRAWLVLRSGGWDVVQFDGPVLEVMSDSRLRSRLAALGPDVLGESFDMGRFLSRLRSTDPNRSIGDALLDQHIAAGIGNLWKAELCFAAGIDPWRPLITLQDEEAIGLMQLARELMRRSARDGAGTRPRAVYRRAGLPCPRCQTVIRQRGQGDNNRSTFWCPGCQS
jgi:endonuclease-8